MIILEGPDGAGKTSLAHFIRETLNIDLSACVHHGPYDGVEDMMSVYMSSIGDAKLMDRSWWSEFVYGTVHRGRCRLTRYQLHDLDYEACRRGAIMVMCLPPLEDCVRAYNSRRGRELLADADQLRRVYDMYSELTTGMPTVYYDYTVQSMRSAFKGALNFYSKGMK